MSGIAGILLAAGASRRFGANKLLQPLAGGEAVGVAAARNLVAAVPAAVAVVRPGDRALADALAGAGLQIVENPVADTGLGTSLAAGVAATPDASGWIVALADMPWIRPDTIAALADALRDRASLVAPTYDGRRGHPVGFAARWRAALLALTGDRGARDIVATHADVLTLLRTRDAGVLCDVDRASDLTPPGMPSLGMPRASAGGG